MSKLSNVTNYKEFFILCEDATQRAKIIDLLMREGIKWHGESQWKSGKQVENSYPFSFWPVIGVGWEGRKDFMNGRSDKPHNAIGGKIFLERYFDE